MFTKEEGIQAIIDLQKAGGITETREQAKASWESFNEEEKISTEMAHKAICGGKPN